MMKTHLLWYRILLCFGYLGTVRHRHHRHSSSPRTRHQHRSSTTTTSTTTWYSCHHFDTIPEARPVTSSWYWTYHSCHYIDSHHSLTPLRCLPIETSHWVLPATRLVHISDHTSHSIHTSLLHILVSSLVSQSCHRILTCYLGSSSIAWEKSSNIKEPTKLLRKEER